MLPSGDTLLLLINYLKSKGFGTQADANARRLRQATRVRDIYDAHRAAGVTLIAVIGDEVVLVTFRVNDRKPKESCVGHRTFLQSV